MADGWDPALWDMSQMQSVNIPGVGMIQIPTFNSGALNQVYAKPAGGNAGTSPLPAADPTTGVGTDAMGNPMPGYAGGPAIPTANRATGQGTDALGNVLAGWQDPDAAPARQATPLPANTGPGAQADTPAAAAPRFDGTKASLFAEGGPLAPKKKEWDFTPATRFEADESKGFGTPYYGAMTNSGDLGAAIWAGEGQRVRLVDPKTGQVVAEGVGEDGSREIATLANAISKKLGKKASWEVQVDRGAGTGAEDFQMVGKEGVDKSNSLLKTVVNIAAPILGAMIPGIGPALGAALGGFGGSLATGANLKNALLSAATAGVGNSLGGALSGFLRSPGAALNFAGANPLGALGSRLSNGGLSGVLGNIGSGAADFAAGELAGAVAPLTVTAGTGGLTSAVTGALGTALGAGAGQALAGGAGGAQAPGTTAPGGNANPTPPENVVEGIEVTPGQVNNPVLNAGGLAGLGQSIIPGGLGGQTPEQIKGFEDQAKDFAGQTAGQLGGTMGVYGLAQLLGLFNGANDTAAGTGTGGGSVVPGNVGDGSSPSNPIPGTPGGGVTPTGGPSGGGMGGAGFGGSGGALAGLLNTGGGGGASLPLASAPAMETEGSLAPDIYPWRKMKQKQVA